LQETVVFHFYKILVHYFL